VSGMSARMLRGCYEETASVEFKLYARTREAHGVRCIAVIELIESIESVQTMHERASVSVLSVNGF